MTFGTTLGEHLTMTACTNMFYIATDYKNKTNMKVAASKKFGFNKRIAEYNFFIFIVFRFKTKLIKMRSSRNRTTERGESGSLWNQMY